MSSTEPLYLIAHKVRGEQAFDIAIQMVMADGLWWVIPTSGHRAYPYWWTSIDPDGCPGLPHDLPDHYPLPAAAKRQSIDPYTDLMVARPEKTKPFTPTAEDL